MKATTKAKTIIIFLVLAAVLGLIVVSLIQRSRQGDVLGTIASIANYDTTTSGFTHATTTVNTTSTQIFATISRVDYIINNTTSTITCSLDPSNTTAASSSVASGRGVIIGSNAGTVISSEAAFGECRTSYNCYPHKGAVNCLANVAATITTSVQ